MAIGVSTGGVQLGAASLISQSKKRSQKKGGAKAVPLPAGQTGVQPGSGPVEQDKFQLPSKTKKLEFYVANEEGAGTHSIPRVFGEPATFYYKRRFKKAYRGFKKTVKQYKQANGTVPAIIMRMYGVSAFKSKKYKIALKLLMAAFGEEKDKITHSFYLFYIGQTMMKKKMYDAAAVILARCTQYKDNFAIEALFHTGVAYGNAEEKKKAKRFFNKYLKTKPSKKMKKKTKAWLKRLKRLSLKAKQWQPNQAIEGRSKDIPAIFNVLYLKGAFGGEFYNLARKAANSSTFEPDDVAKNEELIAPDITVGVGPYALGPVNSRVEYNLASQHFTDEKALAGYFQPEGKNPFPADKWYLNNEIMIDQNVSIPYVSMGYNFLYDMSLVDLVASTSQRRILPWLAVEYADHFRTRIFYNHYFRKDEIDVLSSKLQKSGHFSQDFYFPNLNFNLYLEGFYKVINFEQAIFDNVEYGGMFAADAEISDWLIARLLLIYGKATYSETRLRLPKSSQLEGKSREKDPSFYYPLEIDLNTQNIGVELDLLFTFAERHGVRLRGFFNKTFPNNDYVIDYAVQELGVRLEYSYAYPDLRRIRRRIRYGIFGLF